MRWFQTKTPRIENQFNQPLSSAAIFLPSTISCLLSAHPWLSKKEKRWWEWESVSVDRTCAAGKNAQSLAFAAWNSLQLHLLDSCCIMVIWCSSHLWHKVPAKTGLIFHREFSTCHVSLSIGKCWVQGWIPIGFYVFIHPPPAPPSKKNLI